MKPSFCRNLLIVATLGACATAPNRLTETRIATGIEIAAYALHEECIALEVGERIGYRFNVEPSVAFNIQFHEGGTVIMPVNVASTVEEWGELVADRKQLYCLTWEAGAQPARLNYRLRPLPLRP